MSEDASDTLLQNAKDRIEELEATLSRFRNDKYQWETAIHRVNELEEILKSRPEPLADQLDKAKKESAVFRLLVAKANIPCAHCGLEDISKCKLGFPGCAKADDIMVGEDEHTRSLLLEQMRVLDMLKQFQQPDDTSVFDILDRVTAHYAELLPMPGIVNAVQAELSQWHKATLDWHGKSQALTAEVACLREVVQLAMGPAMMVRERGAEGSIERIQKMDTALKLSEGPAERLFPVVREFIAFCETHLMHHGSCGKWSNVVSECSCGMTSKMQAVKDLFK